MSRISSRLGWLVAGVLGLFVIASVTGVVSGGPLDPPGDPAPTGRPLDELLGSWSRRLPANDAPPGANPAGCGSSRFKCIFDDEAVLDMETGLVWTRLVQSSPDVWGNARTFCAVDATGGRAGWRLPTLEEIASLANPFGSSPPVLPEGHPFFGVSANTAYWTASEYDEQSMWLFWFDYSVGSGEKAGSPPFAALYWCVRGGQGPSAELPAALD